MPAAAHPAGHGGLPGSDHHRRRPGSVPHHLLRGPPGRLPQSRHLEAAALRRRRAPNRQPDGASGQSAGPDRSLHLPGLLPRPGRHRLGVLAPPVGAELGIQAYLPEAVGGARHADGAVPVVKADLQAGQAAVPAGGTALHGEDHRPGHPSAAQPPLGLLPVPGLPQLQLRRGRLHRQLLQDHPEEERPDAVAVAAQHRPLPVHLPPPQPEELPQGRHVRPQPRPGGAEGGGAGQAALHGAHLRLRTAHVSHPDPEVPESERSGQYRWRVCRSGSFWGRHVGKRQGLRHQGRLPGSVRLPDLHLQPVRGQRDGGRHAVQRAAVPEKWPLCEEELHLLRLPPPQRHPLPDPARQRALRRRGPAVRRRPAGLGPQLHLPVLRRAELLRQAAPPRLHQGHLGLTSWRSRLLHPDPVRV